MNLDSILDRMPAGSGERERIRRAYAFAASRHEGRHRRSGAPYITHPLAVAGTAAAMGMDAPMICAALLHDVLADTTCGDAELSAEFGDEITALVRDLTDLEAAGDAGLQTAADRVLTEMM
ncbi:HD domain-containing protein [Actinomadura monticuli]|uniref:HD domain-containing protein n=1 Tax=Actinomadura monticuli TaxID=3097367 RepID=A0ABV4QKT5_9ACTN